MTKNLERELIAIIEPDGDYALDWQYLSKGLSEAAEEWQENFYEVYLKDRDYAWWLLGVSKNDHDLSPSMGYIYKVAATFVKNLIRTPGLELLREKAAVTLEDHDREILLAEIPYLLGAEFLDEHWLDCAWDKLHQVYDQEIKKYSGSINEYFRNMNPDIHVAGKVYFHLVESQREDYPFAFLATYAAEAQTGGAAKHLPLKNALTEYGENSRKLLELLATVNKAAGQSAFVSELLESGEIFHPIGLNSDEAYTFLKEVSIYEEAGILCRIPNWWRKKSESVKAAINIGSKAPSLVGFEALVDFNVQLSLGGETITLEELQKLLAETEGLAFIKGKWVEVDHERLRETLEVYEQAHKMASKGAVTMMEAMRIRLNPLKSLKINEKDSAVEVSHGEWLETLLTRLRRPETIATVDCGDNFKAVLRDYQQKGLNWLYTMRKLGLGACLADDMGLGKTVQVIALLNSLRSSREEKVLLVIPASLIGNWTTEIDRFAPGLTYQLIHPQDKNSPAEPGEIQAGICITTYGMVARTGWLQEVLWDIVILDEAQAIKNPGTKQTKSVKQLKAHCRIALTGTPVENRLADLWSIFDFLNQGLLGNAREFSGFAKKLKDQPDDYGRLKQVTAPFILRRLKSDKSIIADLPEKIEMKSYASLGKKQAALYMSLIKDLQRKLETSEGIERKGLVLASLMKFKQICNHPDQYLGQDAYLANESGKYDRLREICETIYAKRERVIVFTQFREITDHLADFLQTVFHHEGLVLHGQTPVAKRKDIVAKFQGPEYVPFMILSIKAGGVGLNLTAANHVIHFDRWWNPAVENQATDRAFRIGQKKNVLVHKLITRGTIEEKIDLMIEDKIKMTQEIIPDLNEAWITELDNQQLLDLFRLAM
ncbi:MAG TPA: DEAD/DEAH box helicase [Prolixibacteraceae bacterium]|nr:DEAD/DEAH box helicase [Prolixibacteraceae bacterium]